MKITSIIENTSNKGLPVEHGLSLYIENDEGRKILFDMGQSSLFARNAVALSLSVADVDIAVVSHGHYDHGGGLSTFLSENRKAKVYIHKKAFLPHYSLRDTGLRYIGLDEQLQTNERLVFCDDLTCISNGMTVFADVQGNSENPKVKNEKSHSAAHHFSLFNHHFSLININPIGNRLLFGPSKTENDSFCHEQSLIVEEGENVFLFAGCAHRGIVNILRKAEEVAGKPPTYVFAGMHLVKSGLDEAAENTFIELLASELIKYKDTMFYTMHCTGEEQYKKLKSLMGRQIEYMACGDSVMI